MTKTRIYWLLQICGWALYATINMIFAQLREQFNLNYFLYSSLLAGWYIFSTHIFRLIILKYQWITAKIKHILLNVFICIALLTIVNFFIHILIWMLIGAFSYEYDLDPTIISVYLLSSFVLYFIWTLLYFIIHYFERYNTALKYEALKNEIELANLKSQLNPHFIFNALNSIRALVDEDPKKSKDAITRLSNILRTSLVSNKNKVVKFSEEMHAVRDYLNLETMRFEERLRITYDIDPASENFTVPPMMIQTLVENCIKHGISKLKEGGEIHIKTQAENSLFKIKIRNTGQLNIEKLNGTKGLGIENTIQRLKLLYGNNASFNIKNETVNTVLTEVILPQNL